MSIFSEVDYDPVEPDWDAGTETRYEQHLKHVSSGLCVRCHNDASLPDDPDGFCRACVVDVEGVIADFEAAA